MSKSSITTDPELLPNPTPGEILLEEFLRPLGLSQTALAGALRVPRAASTRSCSANEWSPPTPTFA